MMTTARGKTVPSASAILGARLARRAGCTVAACAVIAAVYPVPGWAQMGGLFTNLYGDKRAHQVGDTLHLIITEASSASLSADLEHQRKTSTSVGPGLGKLSFLSLLGFSASSQSTASGTSTRGGSMSARMTVQIVEITPTGNFIVEGQRSVSVVSDTELIRIRGEVRAKDVRPDNTIYSYDLANVKIDYVGSDPRKPRHKVGLITRLLNFLF